MIDNQQYLPRTPTLDYTSNSDPMGFTRIICGGLILPTIATIFGKLLFQRINSNFQRSIIGGIAFIGIKGILKIYYKQQQFIRQAHRQIKNFEPPKAVSTSTSTSSGGQTASSNSNNFLLTSNSNSNINATINNNNINDNNSNVDQNSRTNLF
jgi:hypothetical protein